MNVNDFENPVEIPEDTLQDIFKHQHELAVKYLDIEAANGLLQTRDIPVNLNDHRGQARIKDMFWRSTEEIAEALEALDDKDYTHFYEELADSMHFLVEACILAGVYPPFDLGFMFNASRINQPPNTDSVVTELVELYTVDYIKAAGLACNCLKNKPWKQTQMLTDEPKFKKQMGTAFTKFIALCKVAGFNSEGLYNMYMRKHQVNKFRQRSGY